MWLPSLYPDSGRNTSIAPELTKKALRKTLQVSSGTVASRYADKLRAIHIVNPGLRNYIVPPQAVLRSSSQREFTGSYQLAVRPILPRGGGEVQCSSILVVSVLRLTSKVHCSSRLCPIYASLLHLCETLVSMGESDMNVKHMTLTDLVPCLQFCSLRGYPQSAEPPQSFGGFRPSYNRRNDQDLLLSCSAHLVFTSGYEFAMVVTSSGPHYGQDATGI
jgi:hypothetical protein